MKNLILLVVISIFLFSCTKGPVHHKTVYFEVKNLTAHQVKISFFGSYSSNYSILQKEYNIPPNFSGILDTGKYEYVTSGDGGYCNVLTSNNSYVGDCWTGNSYYWGRASLLQFNFDDLKITDTVPVYYLNFKDCDTSSVISPCFIIEQEEKEEWVKKSIEVVEKITYYITNQQYLLADSI